MKTVLTILASICLMTSSAMAFEGIMKVQSNGDVQLQPVNVVCKIEVPATGDEPDWEVCRPADGVNCGEGYHRMHKYCWKGWTKGFGRCGYVCEKDRRNENDPSFND